MKSWVGAVALVLLACEAPAVRPVEEECANSLDDDGDGRIDCLDPVCSALPHCVSIEICANHRDDDRDGLIDCSDDDCDPDPLCMPCGNGAIDVDEDCDGRNLAHKDCTSLGFLGGTLSCASCKFVTSGCSSTLAEICGNVVDDDGDGLADCADPDCSGDWYCTCGDNVIDAFEYCDGTALPADETCLSNGFPGGTITCGPDCDSVDTSACHPPVCGDGLLGLDEDCDDGNAAAEDGCSPTCRIEPGPLCALATPVALGTTSGTTIGGTTGFAGSCMSPSGAERLYTFTPATTGTLTITLDSDAYLALYVRSSCVDARSELDCSRPDDDARPTLTLPVSAGQPITIFVDAWVALGGEFTLALVQTP